MKKVKAVLSFPPCDIGKSITYHLVKDFDLWVNILHAEIAPTKTGKLVVDIEGSGENIERAVQFLKEQDVTLRVLNGSISLSADKCVDCGACTSVCPSGALSMDPTSWTLVFEKDKCYVCQSCVKACPVRAMTITI